MKRTLLLIITLHCLFSCSPTKEIHTSNFEKWRYELEPVNTGTQGNYQIKVWSYDRTADRALFKAKMNAVHGVLFKGFSSKNRIKGQRPIITNIGAEKEHEAFFDDFFSEEGDYINFVNLTNKGAIAPGDRLRVGNEYKVGVVVTVNVNSLRKHMEQNNIIKGLSDGF